MGVQQFSEVLASAGRPVNLRAYKQGIRPLILPYNHNDDNNHDDDEDADPDDDDDHNINDFQRPLRIGVDISSWIFKACQGFSDMLGDERHLTNYGRAKLQQQQQQQQQERENSSSNNNNNKTTRTTTPPPDDQVLQYVTKCANFCLDRLKTLRDTANAELLVVFDGKSPPVKYHTVRGRSQKRLKAQQERDEPVHVGDDDDDDDNEKHQQRRIRAFRQAGAGKHYNDVVSHVMLALRENSIAFLVAPYESDGQLAFLSLKNYIDLVVTEDSDLAAYGLACPVLYKLPDALGRDGEPQGILLRRQDLGANYTGRLNLLDFSPIMMAVMFVAAGSDYCQKLKGIGIVGACNIVREAFLAKRKNDPLAFVFERLFSQCWGSSDMTEKDKKEYKKNFLGALLMFRHPVVYDPVKSCCVTVGDDEGGDPELMCHKPYAKLMKNREEREKVVGSPICSPLATYVAEGWISPRTMRPRCGPNEIPEHVRSYFDSSVSRDVEQQDSTEDDDEEFETQEIEVV